MAPLKINYADNRSCRCCDVDAPCLRPEVVSQGYGPNIGGEPFYFYQSLNGANSSYFVGDLLPENPGPNTTVTCPIDAEDYNQYCQNAQFHTGTGVLNYQSDVVTKSIIDEINGSPIPDFVYVSSEDNISITENVTYFRDLSQDYGVDLINISNSYSRTFKIYDVKENNGSYETYLKQHDEYVLLGYRRTAQGSLVHDLERTSTRYDENGNITLSFTAPADTVFLGAFAVSFWDSFDYDGGLLTYTRERDFNFSEVDTPIGSGLSLRTSTIIVNYSETRSDPKYAPYKMRMGSAFQAQPPVMPPYYEVGVSEEYENVTDGTITQVPPLPDYNNYYNGNFSIQTLAAGGNEYYITNELGLNTPTNFSTRETVTGAIGVILMSYTRVGHSFF